MRVHYRTNTYRCGSFVDVDVYPVQKRAKRRGAKCKPTTAAQEECNRYNANRRIIRLIHANFCEDDFALHCTYADDPTDADAIMADLRRFLRALRRYYKKADAELRYIAVAKRGEKGRGHLHMVLSGAPGIERDRIEALWAHGRCNCDRLQFTATGCADLAAYIVRPDEELIGSKRWSCSRNLYRPQPEEDNRRLKKRDMEAFFRRDLDTREIAALFPGLVLVDDYDIRMNEINGDYYMHLRFRREDAQRYKGYLYHNRIEAGR